MTTTDLRTPVRPKAAPPLPARWATILWFFAVAAGVAETVVAVTLALSDGAGWSGLVGQVALRCLIYGTLFVTIDRYFRRGVPWSRWFLTVTLGVVGLPTLVIGPIQWLLDTPDLSALPWDAGFITFATIRTVHILAVLAALVLTHHPETIRWFKKQ